jgi:hypothetical protein
MVMLYGIVFIAFPEHMSRIVTGAFSSTAAGLMDMRTTCGEACHSPWVLSYSLWLQARNA